MSTAAAFSHAPDIAPVVPDGANAGLHLLDANFRLDRLEAILPGGEDGADPPDERRGTFWQGDLYKMHTYRDAIAATRSVWALNPGSEFRFFDRVGAVLRSATGPLPASLDGAGAIPVPPAGDSQPELGAVLERVLGISRE